MTLGLASPAHETAGSRHGVAARSRARLVEVAVDAAGAGGTRPYTYRVPAALARSRGR